MAKWSRAISTDIEHTPREWSRPSRHTTACYRFDLLSNLHLSYIRLHSPFPRMTSLGKVTTMNEYDCVQQTAEADDSSGHQAALPLRHPKRANNTNWLVGKCGHFRHDTNDGVSDVDGNASQ